MVQYTSSMGKVSFEEETIYNNGYQVAILTWDDHIGEAMVFNDNLIHLGIARKE